MDLKLNGKCAFVSGSTAGIGLAIAQSLAKEGAEVWVNGRTQERVDQAISDIKSTNPNASVNGVAADLSTKAGADQVIKSLADVDILINNTGIFQPKNFFEIPDEEWQQFFDVNIMSGVRLSRYYLSKMLEKNWGRIMFISSESGINIPVEMIHYGMTKTAQLSISRGLAELTKGTNVTVNSILPGPTMSEGVSQFVEEYAESEGKSKESIKEEFVKEARPTSLIQRFATCEEVANTVAYFSSPLSSATNGASIRVDGGVIKTIY